MSKRILSVDKAVSILGCFSQHEELGITDIVNLSGLQKSTVYDLVNTLHLNGMLEQNLKTKKYQLGIKLFEFGCLYGKRNTLKKRAERECLTLAQYYTATVHLATHDSGEVIYIDKYEDPQAKVSYSHIGKRAPMTCTGVGKAMLAFLGSEYLEKYIYSQPFPRETEKSILSKHELEESIKQIKSRGYATDYDEIIPGVHCVAAPIFNIAGNVIASISISCFAQLITPQNQEQIGAVVKQAAHNISRGLT